MNHNMMEHKVGIHGVNSVILKFMVHLTM